MQQTLAGLDRAALIDRYRRNRTRSAEIFGLVADDAFYGRPIPLRHPFVFYEGHIPAFSFLTLNERALGEGPIDAGYEKLFERGIDPGTLDDAERHARSDWPTRDQVAAFARACDERVEHAFSESRIENPDVPRLVRAQSAFTILEHEVMHHETLMYIVHQLDPLHKRRVVQRHDDRAAPRNAMRTVAAGSATLGADGDEIAFGWDNEFGKNEVAVPAFEIMTYPVTNADWMAFVRDGGPVPEFWVQQSGEWRLRGTFEELPLPESWPVYVSHRYAEAYAAWAGMRLPTEAEYHRAAFSTPAGDERAYPWGDDAPRPEHGNFGFVRFDPVPVGSFPLGASAWGINDLVGNGWEWTSTPFAPLPGFRPMASYPQYSVDFFDDAHFVIKGASPVTHARLVRRSFRNWFRADYPYVYATFRCVA